MQDSERRLSLELLVDSIVRQVSMPRDQLEGYHQLTQAIAQQQNSSGMSNADSSGGTNRTEINSSDNIICLFIERSAWLEEAIFANVGDASKANYKTLGRRISQSLRSKPDFKDVVIKA